AGMELPLDLDELKLYWTDPVSAAFLAPCLQSAEMRKTCVSYFAAHEFGHALGLRHEQDRSTVTRPCDREEFFNSLSGVTFRRYDPASIMNYCKDDRVLGGSALSRLDGRGIRRLYAERPVPGQFDPGRPTVWVQPMLGAIPTVPSGRELKVMVQFRDVYDVKQLPDPARLIAVTDGQRITLRALPWAALPYGGPATEASWTAKAGAARSVSIEWNQRYAGSVTVSDLVVGVRVIKGSAVGQNLELELYVLAQPNDV